jgi:Uma2 family endonuclease
MVVGAQRQVEYPESDGMPMGETDLHRDWMVRILDILRFRYRGQRVYLASDLLVYYEEGEPARVVVPDNFVVKDCDPGRRRTFKIWEEGRVPNVAFEVTSRSSRWQDQVYKPQAYAQIGIQEYFLYDPTGDYLNPPLKGYRLTGTTYQPIVPDATGGLYSEQLDVVLRLEGGDLVFHDGRTGVALLSEAEAADAKARAAQAEIQVAQAKAEAALAEVQAARAAAEAAKARAAELEAELERLRSRLQRGSDDT